MTTSNTATTIHQVRQDYQYDSSVDGLLKNVYIPALNNVTFHATPLMEMFGEFGGQVDFAANKIIKAFKHQGAGGFGAISEGGDWVKSRVQKGFQGAERIKYLNAFCSLSGPSARTVKAGAGGYVDAISSAMDDTLKLAKMQMERIIGGSGNGVVAQFTHGAIDEDAMANGEYVPSGAGASGDTPVALTGTAGTGGYTPCQWLQEGLRVHIMPTTELDGTIATSDFVIDNANTRALFTVTNVDYAAGTFALKFTPYVSSSTCDIDADTAAAMSVVLENAYGEIETAGGVTIDQCLEPNGLSGLVAADGTIWGLTRTTYPWALKSTVEAAGGAELDEELLMGWILDLVNIKQSVPDVLVTSPKARLKYFSNRKEDRRFDTPIIDTPFGFRSTGVVIDQYTLMLQSLTSLKPDELYMLKTGDFKFVKATNGFEWVTNDAGGYFRQREGSDNMYASAVNYMNFVCENPNGQFKATGLSY